MSAPQPGPDEPAGSLDGILAGAPPLGGPLLAAGSRHTPTPVRRSSKVQDCSVSVNRASDANLARTHPEIESTASR